MLKYRQVVELLRQRICNGEYPDGTLPAIRQLAEDLGVSYLTARKAVKELKESGIIFKPQDCDRSDGDETSAGRRDYAALALFRMDACHPECDGGTGGTESLRNLRV